jgi:hypothetical protein
MNIEDLQIDLLITQLTRETQFPINKDKEKGYYVSTVMSMSENEEVIEKAKEIIRKWVKNNVIDYENIKLKAMCYSYEKIIANSNFKPLLEKE